MYEEFTRIDIKVTVENEKKKSYCSIGWVILGNDKM